MTKPMGLEQVMCDLDSEDEVDNEVADFEDRQVFHEYFLHSLNKQNKNGI